MKWVEIDHTHINTHHIQTFYWIKGKLLLSFVGRESMEQWEDPNKELYLKLCRSQGVQPYEEAADGE